MPALLVLAYVGLFDHPLGVCDFCKLRSTYLCTEGTSTPLHRDALSELKAAGERVTDRREAPSPLQDVRTEACRIKNKGCDGVFSLYSAAVLCGGRGSAPLELSPQREVYSHSQTPHSSYNSTSHPKTGKVLYMAGHPSGAFSEEIWKEFNVDKCDKCHAEKLQFLRRMCAFNKSANASLILLLL